MATQITHIVFADKIFNTLFPKRNKCAFFIGTCFPDIRYLTAIDREKTHLSDIKINNEDSDFLAGMKFHQILDIVREKYITKNGIYKIIKPTEDNVRGIKLFEDRLFYSLIKNWQEYIQYFNSTLPDELAFDIQPADINHWHQLLQEYFSQPPTPTTNRVFCLALGITPETIDASEKTISEVENNPAVVAVLKSFYQNFESILKEDQII